MAVGTKPEDDLDQPAMERAPYDADAEKKFRDIASRYHDKTATDPRDEQGSPEGIKEGEENPGGGAAQSPANKSSAADPGQLAAAEKNGSGFYKPTQKDMAKVKGLLQKRFNKGSLTAGIALVIIAVITSASSLFQLFRLPHIMTNVDLSANVRLEINLKGRGQSWTIAYITARLLDIDAGGTNRTADGHLLFRADCPDGNFSTVFCKWYSKVRKTGKFEQELLTKHGIRIVSASYRSGSQIKFRPAQIILRGENGEKVHTIDIDPADLSRIPTLSARANNGDQAAMREIQRITGRIVTSVEVEVFENDREARQHLKALLKDAYPGWWNGAKRFLIRRNIQNMTGIRSWKFFEKTRDKVSSNIGEFRSKILQKVFPENYQGGRIIGCLIGINECTASSDAANPKNNSHNPPSAPTDPPPDADANDPGVSPRTDGTAGKVTAKILGRLNVASSAVGLVDTLYTVDKMMQNGTISAMITIAAGQQLVALYTQMQIASDQLKTQELTMEEFGQMNTFLAHATNGEGWQTVIQPSISGISAEELQPAADKSEFCSPEFQAKMEANPQWAEGQYQYACRAIGGNVFESVEAGWNRIMGPVIRPILNAYGSTLGGIVSFLDGISSAITGPIISGTIAALGLQDNIASFTGWLGEKFLAFIGEGPMFTENTPSAQMVNYMIMGAAYLSETVARFSGAAVTNGVTRQETTERYYASLNEQKSDQSLAERYLDINNPRSLLSRTAFSMSNWSADVPGSITSFATNAMNPFKSLAVTVGASSRVSAAPGPYAAANFAGIETYDLPATCMNLDPITMTPQDATNADDMGIYSPGELSWALLSNKDRFFEDLYSRVGENGEATAKQVWNCALFDNMVSTGMGALYGYKGENAFQ